MTCSGLTHTNHLSHMYVFFRLRAGTGKTTVARRMGKQLETLGLLKSGDTVVECSVSDLQTGFAGQAAIKTIEKFKSARGGVLFIDEAYQLGDGSTNMSQIVGEIVKLVTDPNYEGKMMVILAGYEDKMKDMLNVNEGLRSRFSRKIKFAPFSASTVKKMMTEKLFPKKNFLLADEASNSLLGMAEELVKTKNFASGRDVETWFQLINETFVKMKSRKKIAGGVTSNIPRVITVEMLRESLDVMLDGRESTNENPPLAARNVSLSRAQEFQPSAACETFTSISMEVIEAAAEEEEKLHQLEVAGGDDEEDPIYAALQKSCVDLGYDDNLAQREILEAILEKIEKGGHFPKDIIDHVQKLTSAKKDKIEKVLRPQVSKLKQCIHEAITIEKEEIARVEEEERKHQGALKKAADDEKARLEVLRLEAERSAAIALEVALQKKVQSAGICPAGFTFHREGCGWRCNGGSHYVADVDL
jgi:hypothetical protein